jgi:hypothetical protein
MTMNGRENMSYYSFSKRVTRKGFCKTCGLHVTNELNPSLTEDEVAALPDRAKQWREHQKTNCGLNIRLLNDFDIDSPKTIKKLDLWNIIQPMYVNP